jgi:hypothetical protein
MTDDLAPDHQPKPYAVGYCKPPASGQFKPGHSGNPNGRPKDRPSLDQLLLEEAARLVKWEINGEIMHFSKERLIIRKLIDLARGGSVAAARLFLDMRTRAEQGMEAAPAPEEPLTADELDALKIIMNKAEKKND